MATSMSMPNGNAMPVRTPLMPVPRDIGSDMLIALVLKHWRRRVIGLCNQKAKIVPLLNFCRSVPRFHGLARHVHGVVNI